MLRRTFLVGFPLALASGRAVAIGSDDDVMRVVGAAGALPALRTVIVARHGQIVAEQGFRGFSTLRSANIKSASKVVVSAMVGMAIDRGILGGVDEPIASLLRGDLPAASDPRINRITIGHLLSMQAGLRSTSGPSYGAWVASRNWVRAVLAQPFVEEPGGPMVYSTGSTHLLCAILTRRTGRSMLELSRLWFGGLDGFVIASWMRDPQGIHLGGNEMAMSPRSLLSFGELFRNSGTMAGGVRLISKSWVDASWTLRTHSRFTGDGYGYGWFLRRVAEEDVRYGWGYGGQMLYVVPRLGLTVVMTSDDGAGAARSGHRDALHELLGEIILVAGRGARGTNSMSTD